jgi:hypothetical protein
MVFGVFVVIRYCSFKWNAFPVKLNRCYGSIAGCVSYLILDFAGIRLKKFSFCTHEVDAYAAELPLSIRIACPGYALLI